MIEGATYEVIENLIANDTRHLKALLASDRVHNHVSMNADKVLRVEDTVFILVTTKTSQSAGCSTRISAVETRRA